MRVRRTMCGYYDKSMSRVHTHVHTISIGYVDNPLQVPGTWHWIHPIGIEAGTCAEGEDFTRVIYSTADDKGSETDE